jgi:hypothetical protein
VPGLEQIIYVDDSYREESGLIVFGWVACHPVEWRRRLRHWLEHRKYLRSEYGVRVDKEFHATHFVNGRGVISDDHRVLDRQFIDGQGRVLAKSLGRAIAVDSLQAVESCEFLQVGAVWRSTNARGDDFTAQKYELYAELLAVLDRRLAAADAYGFIVMDGDDPHFRMEHRKLKLDSRHIVEDPVMHDSRKSQWVQMADLVAYTAFMHLNRHQDNEFGWEWYNMYLAPKHGAPIEL